MRQVWKTAKTPAPPESAEESDIPEEEDEAQTPAASDETSANAPTRVAGVGEAVGINPETRSVDVIITTNTRDRQGDIVESSGLDFTHYLNNPVVLWSHDLARPPVGRVHSLVVGDGQVMATVEFADTPFAREVFDLYAQGVLRAWSIGFLPKEVEPLPATQEFPAGVRVLAAEVVEVSAVPVPANPEALTRALELVKIPALRKSLLCNPSKKGVRLSAAQMQALGDTILDTLTQRSMARAFNTARGRL